MVGFAIAKWDIRKTFWFGCALLVIGAVGIAFFATQAWHYLLWFGLIMGTGMAFGSVVPATTTCMRWFVRFRGRAIAIVLTASSFGGFLGAPLINKILTGNGGDWRQAWLWVAAFVVIAGIVIYFFIKGRPEEIGQVPDGISEDVSSKLDSGKAIRTTYDWTPAEVFRTPSFWLVLVGVVACKVPFFFFTAHGMLHAKGAGISATDAAMLMGLFTMGGIPGRLIGGWLMDKMAARYVFSIGLCCYIVGCILDINMGGSVTIAYAAAILIGAGFGWTFVAVNTLPGQYYGPKAFAKVSGTFITLAAIVSSPIGAIGGILYDKFNNYAVAFEFCIAACIVGIIALMFARMPQPPATKSCDIRRV